MEQIISQLSELARIIDAQLFFTIIAALFAYKVIKFAFFATVSLIFSVLESLPWVSEGSYYLRRFLIGGPVVIRNGFVSPARSDAPISKSTQK